MRWPSKDPADYAPGVRAPREARPVSWWNGGAPYGLYLRIWVVTVLVVGAAAWLVTPDGDRVLWAIVIVAPLARFGADLAWRLTGHEPVGPWLPRVPELPEPFPGRGPSKDPDRYR